MIDKRFKLTDTNYIYDTQDKAIYLTLECIVKHLNELHEENEALKKFVKVNFNDMMAEKMEKELLE